MLLFDRPCCTILKQEMYQERTRHGACWIMAMTIQVEHALSKQEARNRIGKLIEQYRQEYKNELQDLVVDWSEDIAHIKVQARGYSSAGTLEIKERVVDLDFYVPFLL